MVYEIRATLASSIYCAGEREAAADGDEPTGECCADTGGMVVEPVGEVDGESVVGTAVCAVLVLVAVDVGTLVD